ncbi:aldehyde dehydrogenase family protein [Pigmentiphaga sp. H8]|uniref:aldehyde dehydrogenase family protein n=1 Tax=Pigmentiphaga sp. H8 TaxID=2488560 RepID=UPI000F5B8487|nr:aldehyde dehydrogenase family protein [Pigmentiphaga sp. H8]AZG08216.1 aldehyde dehydrogenase family protein [Pigmentiphaga sp. H8]
MQHYRHFYINGEWVAPLNPREAEVINPATELAFATIALGGADDVDAAVRAAQAALPSYSRTSVAERIALFERIIAVFLKREGELRDAATQEMGAPRGLSVITDAALDAFKQAITTLGHYRFEEQKDGYLLRREPIGVCGLITAWNWPVQILSNKVSSALAAGCTVVAKPSEYTPLTALKLAEILHEAGVPKGVFNLVMGDGPTVGHAISSHPGIDMVSITGSTRAGVQVAQDAAPTVKRVCQELGGKSANIVLPDADLQAAARWNIGRGFTNSGQSCHAPTRILVHKDQVDTFVELLVAEARKVVVGDPAAATTTMGPVVNRTQFERVQGYIQKGMDEGAHLACGGPGRPAHLERGYFIRPTVFRDVTSGMSIAREEIFGPVLSVMAYETEDEAVRIANDSAYGLGAYLFTKDPAKAYSVGTRLQAGRVFLNGTPGSTAAPMGGYKQSGNGREMGQFGLEEYLEAKAMFGYADHRPSNP